MKTAQLKQLIACVALAFLPISASHALTIIDNTGIDGGGISPFGSQNTATYGQTFTVGADNHLDSFSMFLRGRAGGNGTLDLRGYVGAWDGSKVSAILFSSATQTMNADGALQEFMFAPNINLMSGARYVAFLSVSELAAQSESLFLMPYGGFGVNTFSGGEFVYYNNGTNFAALSSTGWDCADSCGFGDVWLKASLSTVPEPATLALVGLGLVGLSLGRRKKA